MAAALRDIANAVRAPLQVNEQRAASLGATMFRPFGSSITGTGTLTVWTPTSGTRYVLKGAYVVAVVTTDLAASAHGVLRFTDSSAGRLVPIAAFNATATAGTVLTGSNGPVQLDLREGIPGSAIDATLQIAAFAGGGTLDTGVIQLVGVVWGDEVPR